MQNFNVYILLLFLIASHFATENKDLMHIIGCQHAKQITKANVAYFQALVEEISSFEFNLFSYKIRTEKCAKVADLFSVQINNKQPLYYKWLIILKYLLPFMLDIPPPKAV